MKISQIMKNNKKAVAVAIPVVIILLPLGYSIINSIFSQSAQATEAFLEKPDAKYKNCVKESVYMRINHMILLKEIRDQVVREGNRSDIALNGCSKCHTKKERFCDQCHNAVNLNPTCFNCHSYQ